MNHTSHSHNNVILDAVINFFIALGSLVTWSSIMHFTLTLIPTLITTGIVTLFSVWVKYKFEKHLKRNDKDKSVEIEADDIVQP